jgi:hypothetical protein
MTINHSCCINLVPLVTFVPDARSHIHQIWTVYLRTPYFGADSFNVSRYLSNSERQHRLANVYGCTHIQQQWRLYIFKAIHIKLLWFIYFFVLYFNNAATNTEYVHRQTFGKICKMNRKWSKRKWSWLNFKILFRRESLTKTTNNVCVPSEMLIAKLPCKWKSYCLSNVLGIVRRVRKIPKID